MSLLISIALLSVLLAASYLNVQKKFSYWKRRGVTFLEPTLPFGNFGKVFRQKISGIELFAEIYNSTNAPIIGVYSILSPTIVIRDPKIIRDILIKSFAHFPDRGLHVSEENDPLAKNMVLQTGDKWKRGRNKLSPTFTSGKLKGMFNAIVECESSLQKHIDQYAKSGETFEVRDVLARYTINSIASVAFGIQVDCFKEEKSEFKIHGEKLFKVK